MAVKVLFTLLFVFLVGFWFDRSYPETSFDRQLEAKESLRADQPVPPNAFITDGCTLFPDKLPGLDLRPACLQHDIAYWAGGTGEAKQAADQAFKANLQAGGLVGKLVGPIAYVGVVAFGDSWLTTQLNANWGYGWNQ